MRGERLFARFFDAASAPPALRRFILTELSRPERRWHGLVHHALMLRQVSRADHDARERRLLTLAVLFHDIVYDATRSDNEEASAATAGRWLVGEDARSVQRLILATKTHDLGAADPVTRTLLKADLAVLWTNSAALYRFYAEGIRAEYAHVPDAAYREGRVAVLTQLQARVGPMIGSPHQARLTRNLAWERAELAAGRFDRGDQPAG